MVDGALSDRLSRFGLSDKEIDTYLALLKHGEAKASVIAEEASVSKRYVYSVSEELETKGFVEVNSHVVPTTIRANPPEEVVETLQDDIEAMEPELSDLYAEPEPSREQIEVIKSRTTIVKRMRELLAAADEEIMLSIPESYLDEVGEELRAAVDRGVLVLLIVTDYGGGRSLQGLASVARTWPGRMPMILAVDLERGAFAPAEMLFRSDTDRQGIVFVQQPLVSVTVGSFFGNYWPVSEEQLLAEPVQLPATYSNFRHAALQATLHERAGTDLWASVTGHLTGEDREQVETRGEVLKVVQGLVKPTNNEAPVVHSILLDTNDDVVSVGGVGAFVEDVEAEQVTLEPGR